MRHIIVVILISFQLSCTIAQELKRPTSSNNNRRLIKFSEKHAASHGVTFTAVDWVNPSKRDYSWRLIGSSAVVVVIPHRQNFKNTEVNCWPFIGEVEQSHETALEDGHGWWFYKGHKAKIPFAITNPRP